MPEATTAPSDQASPAKETRGVCVAVLPNEKPVRVYADAPGDFIETINRSLVAWVNFTVDNLKRDGERVASLLGFSGNLVETLLATEFSNYEDRTTEIGIRLPVVKAEGATIKVEPILMLAREDLVLTLHEEGRVTRMVKFAKYADVFMRKIPQQLPVPDRITMIVTRLISQNNDRNFEALRNIQESGDLIGATLANLKPGTNTQALGRQIYQMKNTLVRYLDSLWSSLDVIHSLRYGDAELISDDERLLARIGILGDDVNRQIQLSEHTSEVLVSGLEVLQGMYNNELQRLNNRLAQAFTWLTVLGTVILVPNTIATMFGSYNEYSGRALYMYILLSVVATLAATWLSWYFVRRTGLARETRTGSD